MSVGLVGGQESAVMRCVALRARGHGNLSKGSAPRNYYGQTQGVQEFTAHGLSSQNQTINKRVLS
jgi:hypothetical protein